AGHANEDNLSLPGYESAEFVLEIARGAILSLGIFTTAQPLIGISQVQVRLCKAWLKFQCLVKCLHRFLQLAGLGITNSQEIEDMRILDAQLDRLRQVLCRFRIVLLMKLKHAEIPL